MILVILRAEPKRKCASQRERSVTRNSAYHDKTLPTSTLLWSIKPLDCFCTGDFCSAQSLSYGRMLVTVTLPNCRQHRVILTNRSCLCRANSSAFVIHASILQHAYNYASALYTSEIYELVGRVLFHSSCPIESAEQETTYL